MKIVYPTSLVPVKAGFRVHYTLRLEGATIHVMATHKEMLDLLSRISRRAA
mgnify:CR=1